MRGRRRAEPLRAGSMIQSGDTATGGGPPDDVLPPGMELVGRGVFALARCRACDWEGPARRSRRSAVIDGAAHAMAPPEAPPGA